MHQNLHNAMIAQYATPRVSGNGLVSWDGGVKCVMPGVKMLGAAVQETLTGKNLFDAEWVLSQFEAANYELLNGFYVVSIPTPNGTYTMKAHSPVNDSGFVLMSTVKEVNSQYSTAISLKSNSWETQRTVNVTDGALYIGASELSTVQNYVINAHVQIELGSTATDYEPYCGGIPAPNPSYPIMPVCNDGVVAAHGKNLCPVGSLTFTQTAEIQLQHCKRGVYTFSAIVHSSDTDADNNIIILSNSDMTKSKDFLIGRSAGSERVFFTITMYSDFDLIKLYASDLNKNSIGDTATFADIQLELGDTATPYTPYWDGGQATAPELWAIPGTDIRDEWDAQTGRGIRRVKKLVLDGTESWARTGDDGDNYHGFALKSSDFNAKKISVNAFCNAFLSDISAIRVNSCRQTTDTFGLRFLVSVDYVPNKTTAELKSFLKNLYDSGTPVIFWYVLDTPKPFYYPPARLTQPTGHGQIIQLSGSVPDCPIEAQYLTHAGGTYAVR